MNNYQNIHTLYFIGITHKDVEVQNTTYSTTPTLANETQNAKYSYFDNKQTTDIEPQNIHTPHFVGRTSRDVESNYLEINLPPKFDKFIDAVKKGIKYRTDNYKNDAYFEIPEKITYEQLLILIRKINRFDNESICARLHETNKIHVNWHNSSKKSINV